MKNLVIFGSGSGSNAENICAYFKRSSKINVVCIVTNNKNAFIVDRAKKLNIPVLYITMYDLTEFASLYQKLNKFCVDYIVLAGFLLKIPSKFIRCYPKKIINVHPSLLPKYGGKGMYGRNVHKAVLENKECESGISIHFVNENYDQGEVVLQKRYTLSFDETIDSLEKNVRDLEFEYFPRTIEKIVLS